MLTIKWDNATAMSRQTPRRAPTPYLRGIIIAAGNPNQKDQRLASLVGKRCVAWGDADPIEDFRGTIVEAAADIRDYIEVEDTNQKSYILANVMVKKTFTAEEAAEMQGLAMLAQLENLEERGTRKIERPQDSSITERRLSGEQPATSPEGVAGEALPGGQQVRDNQAGVGAGGGVNF